MAYVLYLQEELSRAIVSVLPLKPVGNVRTPLVRPATDVLDAYMLYLRGRYFWNKRTVEGFRGGVECFERAIERDPGYAHAYAGLADCYAMLGFDEYGGMPALEAMPKAKAAALKALEIDPMLAEAHSSLAVIAMIYDWEWTVAEREFERALSLKPDCFPAVYWYALFLSAMGRHDESIRVITRAQELEPLSLVVHVTVGRCYFMASRYDEAIEHLRAALEMEPEHLQTYVWIARAYCKKGRFQEALAELEKGMSLLGRCPILLATSGYVYGVAGQPGEALEVLDELRQAAQRRYVAPQWEFVILMALDERDQAFKQLDLAYEQRSGYLAFLRASPMWGSLRSDPPVLRAAREDGPR